MKTSDLTPEAPVPGNDLDARLNVARGVEPAPAGKSPLKRVAIAVGTGLGAAPATLAAALARRVRS
jgi:hypothetical protein